MSTPVFDRKNMIYKNLGSTGLKVSAFSLGGWLTYGGTVKGNSITEILSIAYQNGINFFDTAEGYASGKCEEEWGRAFKELGWNRRTYVISTKIYFGAGDSRDTDPNAKGLSRKHVIEGVQDSLARLQLDYVDVIFAHRYDHATPLEEVVRAFNHVIERGWAFYWGTSEWTSAQIEEAIGIANRLNLIPPVVEQPKYSLFSRENLEVNLKPLLTKGYGATIWSPLESGLLTGKYNNGIPNDSRFSTNSEFFSDTVKMLSSPEGQQKIETVKNLTKIADKLGVAVSVLALAWAAQNPHVSTVILGASKKEQLLENLEAIQLIPKLTPEVLEDIEAVVNNKPKAINTWGRQRE